MIYSKGIQNKPFFFGGDLVSIVVYPCSHKGTRPVTGDSVKGGRGTKTMHLQIAVQIALQSLTLYKGTQKVGACG